MTAHCKPAHSKSASAIFRPHRMGIAAVAIILQAGLTMSSALAVVLPETVTNELEQRFDGFVGQGGFTEIDAESLTEGNWYDPARFPQIGSSAFQPDAAIDPVTKSILLVESREAQLPHTRYQVTYRLSAASPDYPDVRYAYVEVTRFNLGPAVHKDVIGAYGAENAAPEKVFGIGPHITWRFIAGEVMGMRASVVRASRKELSDREARAADCLGVPCLSLDIPEGPSGKWQTISAPDFELPVYQETDGAMPGPAGIADYLFSHATRNGEEPGDGAFADRPQMVFVISMNISGQEQTALGLLHRPWLMDDAISDIWTQRLQVGRDLIEWHELTVHRPGRQ
ncbi:hypothetical protein [Mesorhizobium sp. A556]